MVHFFKLLHYFISVVSHIYLQLCCHLLQTLNDIFRKEPRLEYPGSVELAGIIEEVGKNVIDYKKGDRVAGKNYYFALKTNIPCTTKTWFASLKKRLNN